MKRKIICQVLNESSSFDFFGLYIFVVVFAFLLPCDGEIKLHINLEPAEGGMRNSVMSRPLSVCPLA